MNTSRWRCFFFLTSILLVTGCTKEDEQSGGTAIISFDEAKKDSLFGFIGEYTGPVNEQDITVQIAHTGNGKLFAAVFFGKRETTPTIALGEILDQHATFQIGDTVITSELAAEGATVRVNGVALKRHPQEWEPLDNAYPKDAIILFDGTAESLNHWKDGVMTQGFLNPGTRTKAEFGSFQLHLEFLLPYKPQTLISSQDRGNSGIYIFNRYEVQVLDSFGLHYSQPGEREWKRAFKKDLNFKPLSDRAQWCGALYQQSPPRCNASRPPLSLQSYDIDFTAPAFSNGVKRANARITVKHNGIVIHENLELPGGTGHGGRREEIPEGPILLQEHGSPVLYRHIWIRKR